MNTEPAAINVVIPTFNRRVLLERAIASVLAEKRVPLLVSVFDNASSDDTAEFVMAIAAQDSRVIYHRRESNIGGIRNISDGIASVQTKYFVPLADDDYLLPDFLHDAYSIIVSDPELGAVVFGTEARAEDGRLIEVYPAYLPLAPDTKVSAAEHLRLWLRHGHCAWSSILWSSSVLKQVGVPYLDIGLPGDVDFQAQVFASFPAYLVNRPGAAYSIHGAQASGGLDITHLPDWEMIFARLDRNNGLEFNDYLTSRDIAWKRFRGVWNRPLQAPLSRERQIRLALIAGFKLGDWTLAQTLAEGVAQSGPSAKPTNWRIWWLPSHDGQDTGSCVHGDRSDLLLGIIRWFGDSAARERTLAARLAEAASDKSRLQADITEWDARLHDAAEARSALALEVMRGQQRETSLSNEIETLRRRCEQAEQRLPLQRVRRLWARLQRAA